MSLVKSLTSMSTLQFVFVLVAVVTIICAITKDCVLCKHWPISVKNPLQEGFADPVSTQPATTYVTPSTTATSLTLYSVPWCPHCVRIQSEWTKLTQMLAGTPIAVSQVDCEANPEAAKLHNVQSFPDIRLFKNGVETSYEGARDADSIFKWIQLQ